MGKHKLYLKIEDTISPEAFYVSDQSIYTNTLPVDCSYLEITPPGFTTPTLINVEPGFDLVLNACQLGLKPVGDCTDYSEIDDGWYHLRYSVSPNSKIYVEYEYLRTTKLRRYLNELYLMIGVSPVDPTKELIEKLQKLHLLESYIRAAESLVGLRGLIDDGVNLYNYVLKQIRLWQNQ